MKVGIIGAGNLGKAFINGFKEHHDLLVSDIFTGEHNGITISNDNESVVKNSDVILVIVKPDMIEKVLKPLIPMLQEKPLMSFAAGIPLRKYKQLGLTRIARAMPNIAVSEKQGVIGYASTCTSEEEQRIDSLFSCVGKSFKLTEEQLDALTGISGSGIAYLVSIAKSFIQAGEEEGFSKEEATSIVAQTLQGAASLLAAGTPDEWLEKIASKGGATEEGLKTLRERNVDGIVKETVTTTIKKCQDLSKSSTSQ